MNHNITKLLNLLNKNRFELHNDWLEIGSILYNLDKNLLDIFVTFSKYSPTYREGSCEYNWTDLLLNSQKADISCLHALAKNDDPDGYLIYIADTLLEKYNFTDLSEQNLNDILFHIFGYEYMRISTHNWYHFNNHKWSKCETEHVTNNMYIKFNNICKVIVKNEKNLAKINIVNNILQKMNQHINGCKYNSGATNNKFMKDSIYDVIFDTNTNLLGFENGVYELDKKYFRIGYPSDYITMSTNYEYTIIDPNDEKLCVLNNIISKYFPDPIEKENMMIYIASCLDGQSKLIDQWYGGLGKSTFCNLVSTVLGDYVLHSANNMFYDKDFGFDVLVRNIKGTRLVITQDLETVQLLELMLLNKGIKVDYDDLKQYHNIFKNEKQKSFLYGRNLYENGFFFPISHNLLMISPSLPIIECVKHIENYAESFINNINHVQFKSKFVEHPQNDNEYKIDYEMYDKIQLYKQEFMWLLLNKYYQLYKNSIVHRKPMERIVTIVNAKVNDRYKNRLAIK